MFPRPSLLGNASESYGSLHTCFSSAGYAFVALRGGGGMLDHLPSTDARSKVTLHAARIELGWRRLEAS